MHQPLGEDIPGNGHCRQRCVVGQDVLGCCHIRNQHHAGQQRIEGPVQFGRTAYLGSCQNSPGNALCGYRSSLRQGGPIQRGLLRCSLFITRV